MQGELFILQFAALETVFLSCELGGGTKIGDFGPRTQLTALPKLGFYKHHLSHSARDTRTHFHLINNGHGLDKFGVHTARYTHSLKFSKHHPSRHLVEHQALYAAMKGVFPRLIRLLRLPTRHDVVAVFPKLQPQSLFIGRAATRATVTRHVQPGILYGSSDFSSDNLTIR